MLKNQSPAADIFSFLFNYHDFDLAIFYGRYNSALKVAPRIWKALLLTRLLKKYVHLLPPIFTFIQASSVATFYLPIIFKSPAIVYFDNFSNEDSDWAHQVDDGKCYSFYEGGRYRLNVDRVKLPKTCPKGFTRRKPMACLKS